jgi:group I intron endonuclease
MSEDITFAVQPGTYGIIYRLISPSGKSYIGQTTRSLEERWNEHVSSNSSGYLSAAIRKYGPNRFGQLVVATAHNQEGLDAAEDFYIRRFNTRDRACGYNLRAGGSHGKLSEETKKKLSLASLGNTKRRGQVLSDETKEKMSRAKLGKQQSNETRIKISAAVTGNNHPLFGMHCSDATKQKISLAQVGSNSFMFGKHHSESTRAKMREAWIRRKACPVLH